MRILNDWKRLLDEKEKDTILEKVIESVTNYEDNYPECARQIIKILILSNVIKEKF